MAEALLTVTDHYQNANYLIQSFVFSYKQFIYQIITASELWPFQPCRGEGEGGE